MTPPDRERFEQLVRTCHAAVFRAARRVLGDEAAAADATQEVFLRLWTGKLRLAAADQPCAVLVWSAVRQAANAARARRRRQVHEAHAMTDRPAAVPDPADASARRDLLATATRLLDELPDELRLPLLLRHQDDLPLAAIGGALLLPVSTVHDRIQRGLAALRERLQRRGHTLGLAALPDLLAGLPAPPAPGWLEGRLLAVPGLAAAGAVGAKALWGGLAAAGLALGLVVAAVRGGPAAPLPPPVAAAAVAAAPGAPGGAGGPSAQDPVPPRRQAAPAEPPPPPSPPPAAGLRVAFAGTVHDAAGAPVAGASVQPVAGGGYKPFELGAPATTDGRGAFAVTAQSDWLTAGPVRLLVREHGRLLLDSGDLPVPAAGAVAAPLALVLPASAGTAASQYELAVLVRDEHGNALPGAHAALYAGSPGAPSLHWRHRPDAEATSDAGGVATVRGRGTGRRWLFVDGRPLGRACVLQPWPLAAGAQRTEVALPAGAELEVVVAPVPGAVGEFGQPWLEDAATGLWLQPQRRGDHWWFRGLGAGPYTLRCADAAVTGVTAAMQRVAIAPKDPDDPRDRGDHLAELHGELVDAATGAVVPFGPFDVEVHPVLAEGSSFAADGIEPPAPAQRAAEGGLRQAFHCTGLTAGRWAIVAQVEGYAVACATFDLRDRELRAGLRVPLVRPVAVAGRVVDAAGRPVAGAAVFALGIGALADRQVEAWRAYRQRTAAPGAPEPSFTPLRGWTGEDGRFALRQVPADTPLRLVARHDELGFAVVAVPARRAGEAAGEVVLWLERQ